MSSVRVQRRGCTVGGAGFARRRCVRVASKAECACGRSAYVADAPECARESPVCRASRAGSRSAERENGPLGSEWLRFFVLDFENTEYADKRQFCDLVFYPRKAGATRQNRNRVRKSSTMRASGRMRGSRHRPCCGASRSGKRWSAARRWRHI